MLDFYQPNDISCSKEVLVNDAQKLNLGKTPKMTERRDEHRTVKEVDEILSLVTFVDENKAITGLPRYATDDSDRTLTARLE